MTTLTLRLDDREVVARLDASGQVHLDDRTWSVSRTGEGLYLVSDGEQRWTVAVAAAGDARWVSVDGQVAVVDVSRGRAAGKPRRSPRADALMAPMPATVVTVAVGAGQAVEEGETLLVLEAMKMELPIRAPHAGRVKAVLCAAGELVQPGVALVDIESA